MNLFEIPCAEPSPEAGVQDFPVEQREPLSLEVGALFSVVVLLPSREPFC